jgi:hypothetical protein
MFRRNAFRSIILWRFVMDFSRCSSCERGGGTFTNLMSNRDFLQTLVSLLGEFRANGARRVVINFSGERDRQLADGFALNEDPARSEFYKAPEPKHPTFELLTFVLAKTVHLCPGQGTLIEFRLDNERE